MALYDRDYTIDRSIGSSLSATRVDFLKKTYQLLALSMIVAAMGAYLTMPFAAIISKFYLIFVGIEFLILFVGLSMSRGKSGLNMMMLFAFTFMSGVTLTPMLASLIGAGKGAAIVNAFLGTSVLFGALSLFAINSKTDFSSWGKPLFITVIVLIVVSLVNIFFLHSGLLATILSAVVLLVFALFTIYDTQNIVNGAYESPVDAAVSLFIDFSNMFISLLNLLGIMSDD